MGEEWEQEEPGTVDLGIAGLVRVGRPQRAVSGHSRCTPLISPSMPVVRPLPAELSDCARDLATRAPVWKVMTLG
jgi:hypothetical protein